MSQFTDTIQGLNSGETETELSLKFKALVDAVRDTGKKGSITLKLTVEQNKRDRRLYELTAEVKSTVPQAPPQAAAYFMPDGYDTLMPLGHDPRQLALEMGQSQGAIAQQEATPAGEAADVVDRYNSPNYLEVIK